jgi:succinyl-diaminopimelate desuccinylase
MNRQDLSRRVKETVGQLREPLIADTARILQFNTVSGATDEEGKRLYREQILACAEWLEGRVREMGFNWLAKPGRWYCIEWPAQTAGKPIVLGIPTHIDVVPVGGTWTHPPFSGAVADGFIWGRGIQDDKGPLVAVLYGLWALKKIGYKPLVDYRIIVGTQEEIGDWSDIREYLDEQGNPDFGFTPDADFPLITGEKGMLTLRAESQWNAADQPPTGRGVRFHSLKGGTRANVVPDLCEIILHFPAAEREAVLSELFRATAQFMEEHPSASITLLPENARNIGNGEGELLLSFLGKSAHGSKPEKGHNAILDALCFLMAFETFPPALRAYAQFLHTACSDFSGAALHIASTHEFVGPTTVSLGVAHIEETGGHVLINTRPTLGLDWRDAAGRAGEIARAYAEKVGADIVIRPNHDGTNALFLDPKTAGAFLRGLQEGYQSVTGLEPTLKSIGGTTYAKAMPNCCAFGPLLLQTGDEDLTHQTNERFAVKSQVRNAAIYGLALALAGLNLAADSQ